jgi:putative nucleotidyltransferase with HDIG domain
MSSDAHVAQELERVVLARIEAGSLSLPVLPAAATSALSLLRDPDVSLRAVSAVLDRDPMMVMLTLRAANAAVLGASPVSTIDQGLTRLGVVKIRSLLTEVCARRVFQSRDPRIQRACEGLWEHSVAVAILSRDLAALSGSEAEVAYMAGLLHDVAKPVVAAYLLETERVATMRNVRWMHADTWIEVVNEVSHSVSAAIAQRWELPEVLVQTIRSIGEFDISRRNSAGNYVRFANALVKQQGIYVGTVDADAVAALVMVGRSLLGIDEEVLQRMTADLQNRARKRISND